MMKCNKILNLKSLQIVGGKMKLQRIKISSNLSHFNSKNPHISQISKCIRSFCSTTEEKGPLSGIKVLDMGRVLAAPYCSMILGDMGAEIYKIEKPGEGDETRYWGPPFTKEGRTCEISWKFYLCR
jgi:hypothetical protein